MFLLAWVFLERGGGLPTRGLPPERSASGDHPRNQKSEQDASYWNAFLLFIFRVVIMIIMFAIFLLWSDKQNIQPNPGEE